jgi:hypothetical protein
MSDKEEPCAENRSRCALLTLSVQLRPGRDAPSLLLSGFSIRARGENLVCGSAAP